MALEDRCSPQSANSPPGLPQSPQSNQHPFHGHNGVTSSSPCPTTSMLMLINNVIDSKTKLNAAMDYETSSQNGSLKSPDMSPSQLLSSIASKNLFNIQNQLMFQQQQHNNSDKQNSPPATPMRTDDEDEDEDEIDIENDTPKGHNTSADLNNGSAKFLLPSPASPASSQHSPSPQISSPSTPTSTTTPSGNLKFSISQILSDNFGIESKFHQHAMASAAAVAAMQLKSGQHPLQQYPFYHPAMAGMLPNGAVPHPHFNLPPHHPLLFRPYDALDAEIRNQQAAAAAAAAAQQKMKNNFSTLFSSFHQQQQQQTKSTRSSLEDFCDSKLSQLSNGGVGNGISSSNGSGASNGPMRPVSSSSSSSSVNNSINKLTTTTASIKSPSGSSVSGGSTLRPDSGVDSSDDTKSETGSTKDENGQAWPAWIYCTRYSDRPSSGPRYRRPKQPKDKSVPEDKRPRTAFSNEQLARLKREFNENRYLNERRRQELSAELGLNEAQIKIWFQNKRAKIKKTSGQKNPLAMQLMAQGLYNHTTVPLTKEEEELEMRMNGQLFD